MVSELGTGVGYLLNKTSWEVARRLAGRGKPGEDEEGDGSKAGRRADACLFRLPGLGRVGCMLTLLGDESIMLEYPAYLKRGMC